MIILKMIKLNAVRSTILRSSRYLSNTFLKLNDEIASQSDSPNKFDDKLANEKAKKFKPNYSQERVPENVKQLMRSDQPIEGEPVPPAKNRYINTRNPALNAFRPEEFEESKASFFLFPGQGTQFVGMGKKLIKNKIVKELFERANSILGYDLEQICLNGPKNQLDRTLHAQPAIFVTSLAGKHI